MRASLITPVRKFWSVIPKIEDFFFGTDNEGEAKSTSTNGSIWTSVVPVILITIVVNSATFMLMTYPQSVAQMQADGLPRMYRDTVDANIGMKLMTGEDELVTRQVRRLDELHVFDAASVNVSKDSNKSFAVGSEQYQIEASRDLGMVAAFCNIGPEWSREFAKEQRKLISTELDTWRMAQNAANVVRQQGISTPQARNAVQQFRNQRLLLLSDYSEFKAFSQSLKSLVEAQSKGNIEVANSIHLRVEHLTLIRDITVGVLKIIPWIFAVVGLRWLIARIERFERKRKQVITQLT